MEGYLIQPIIRAKIICLKPMTIAREVCLILIHKNQLDYLTRTIIIRVEYFLITIKIKLVDCSIKITAKAKVDYLIQIQIKTKAVCLIQITKIKVACLILLTIKIKVDFLETITKTSNNFNLIQTTIKYN